MRRALCSGIALASLLGAGCAGSSKVSTRTAPSGEGRERAAHFFEERIEEIRTIHAGLELRWAASELDKQLSCRGSLVFQAPSLLRLRGTSRAFFTIFDLTGGENEIWIDIPREKILIRGERNDPEWLRFALDPDLVAIALLAHPEPEGKNSIVIEEDGADLLVAGDGTRMEIDGETGQPRRYWREDSGAEVTWEGWNEVDGTPWPRRVRLAWPDQGDTLEIDFGRVQLGKPIREGYFRELPDEERERLAPSEGIERWAEILEKQQGNL
jgi:hypothetical protein